MCVSSHTVTQSELRLRRRLLKTKAIPEEIAVERIGRKGFVHRDHMTSSTNSRKGQSCIGCWIVEGLGVTTNLTCSISGVEEPRMTRNCQLQNDEENV